MLPATVIIIEHELTERWRFQECLRSCFRSIIMIRMQVNVSNEHFCQQLKVRKQCT